MRKTSILFCVLSLCYLPLFGVLKDIDCEDLVKQEVRINQLLPYLMVPLAIEPAIPPDFVAMSERSCVPNLNEGVFWGPPEVLNAYFEDPKSLSQPIIRVAISKNFFQISSSEFNIDRRKVNNEFNQMGAEDFKDLIWQWGKYPVYIIHAHFKKKVLSMAVVGLNDPEGWTLLFQLICPESPGHPSERDLNFWKNFLGKTTQLSDPLYFKAHGEELHPGYTLLHFDNAKIKIVAERSKIDRKLQIVALPLDPGIEFKLVDIYQGHMETKWHQGEPIVKLSGVLIRKREDETLVSNKIVTVLIKTVNNFSIDITELEPCPGVFIYQD